MEGKSESKGFRYFGQITARFALSFFLTFPAIEKC